MEKIIAEYYANGAIKLRKIVDKIVRKYGGISDKDMDDFYSLANEVFVISLRDYDNTKCHFDFDCFLYCVLVKRIVTEIRDRNRGKRSNTKIKKDKNGKIQYEFIPDISIDSPISHDTNTTIGETLIDNGKEIEEILFQEEVGNKVEKYLDNLPKLARQIIIMKIHNNDREYIIEQLHITSKQYLDAMETMKSSEYISILA